LNLSIQVWRDGGDSSVHQAWSSEHCSSTAGLLRLLHNIRRAGPQGDSSHHWSRLICRLALVTTSGASRPTANRGSQAASVRRRVGLLPKIDFDFCEY